MPGVTVADRLQSPKGLKRRCERYLKEARKQMKQWPLGPFAVVGSSF